MNSASLKVGIPERSAIHSSASPLTPWESVDYFEDMAGRLAGIGIDELVLYWPERWRIKPSELAVMERVAADVIPRVRSAAAGIAG